MKTKKSLTQNTVHTVYSYRYNRLSPMNKTSTMFKELRARITLPSLLPYMLEYTKKKLTFESTCKQYRTKDPERPKKTIA